MPAYDGGDITLNAEAGIVLSPSEFPELLHYKGQQLIVTDGTTLLGAVGRKGGHKIAVFVQSHFCKSEFAHFPLKIFTRKARKSL